ncbi:MAG: DUF642 domain-containing protein [Planctomycetota bacterium]
MKSIAALALCAAAPAAAQLVNPGFEPDTAVGNNNILSAGSTAIPGWTVIDAGAEWFNAPAFNAASPEGGYAVDLANFTFIGGGVEQTFTTEPGRDYVIEFFFGTQQTAGRVGTADITVSADGQSSDYSITNLSPTTAWEARAFAFTADDTQATLRFQNFQNANLHFAYIDGARIIPAPATALLLLPTLAAASRRRR